VEIKSYAIRKGLEVDAVKCFKWTDYTSGTKYSSSTGSDGSSSPWL